MNILKKLTIFLLTFIFITSCSDDDFELPPPLGDYQNGFFITNQGPFANGSGTLTFIQNDGTILQNVYKTVNNEDLGNVVQSMSFYDNKAYIIVQNSNKIVVANRYTMKKITVIEGNDIKLPQHFVNVGNTGYISNWGDSSVTTDDFIAVMDLNTDTVTSTIAVGEGPQNMVVNDDKIYVNLQGGFGQNNKVEVIDTKTNTISSTIIVGDVPNSIVKDSNNSIWVLSGGKPNWTGNETNGTLIKIVNDEIIKTFDFEAIEHPEHLTTDGRKLYYNLNGKVYDLLISKSELNTTPITGLDGFYFTLEAKNGFLYATDAGDFTSEGALTVFDLRTNTEYFKAATGIIPGSIVFQ